MEMISEHFKEYLWPNVIKVAIENAKEKIDPDFVRYVDLTCSLENEEYERQLSCLYERKRDWLKRIYFGFAQPSYDKRLDMHKIAAIICRCLIGCKPFSFDVAKANEYKDSNSKNNQLDWIIDNYFVNYKVAVNCALAITLFDLLDKLGDTKQEASIISVNDIVSQIVKNGFDLYNTDPVLLKSEHEVFYKSLILNVAINDVNKRDFDYLGFATTCFQLQQYEVVRCEYNRLRKS